MLCLDDAAWARVCIAATAVALAERSTWLQNLATSFERPSSPTPSPGAVYTRRWRARRRAGKVLLRPEVDEAAFAVAAVERGLIDPTVADDPAALTAAAQRVLVRFYDGEVSPREPEIFDKVQARLLTAVQRKGSRAGLLRTSSQSACAPARQRR
jgi:hypothetical protein